MPAVVGTREQTGAWDHVRASRIVELSDGSQAHEQLMAYEPPRHFAYRLDGFTGLRLVRRATTPSADQRPREVCRGTSRVRHVRVESRLAQPGGRAGAWGERDSRGWSPLATGGLSSSGCSTASSSASLRRIARVSALSASAGSRSGCGGAYSRRSCSAGPRSAIRWMLVRCLARESAVYAHPRVNSSGRPTTIAFSTVAPWLEWPVIASYALRGL